jgi:hypothetical protein
MDHRQSWSSVASSANGQNLVAVGFGAGIWASIDSGMTWTDRTPADPKFEASYGDQVQGWSSVASDTTGTKLVAAVNTGDVWTSTNGGLTWTDRTAGNQAASGPWDAVTSNAAGDHVVAIGRGAIYRR